MHIFLWNLMIMNYIIIIIIIIIIIALQFGVVHSLSKINTLHHSKT
jgi:hypothetical protein